jgi:hypothetical protein
MPVLFTSADNGRTVDVPLGATVGIRLTECAGTEWSQPVSNDPLVLVPRTAAVDADAGTASADFGASAPGQAIITAKIRRSPCAVPVVQFRLTVRIG